MIPPPDDALIERFASDLARLTSPGGRLLLAVSGGPDSVAMLLLAQAAIPDRIACATVDHGLRAEARSEAAMVGALCSDLGVPHAILTLALAKGGSVQARARAARYDALSAHVADTGCTAILTAHHADDQAETLLMRANRGSGVDGLAGVRAAGRWGDMPVLRPLLGWRRSDLRAVVDAAGLTAADDPTNRDPAHDRSRIRALMGHADEIDPAGLARSAAALADASEAIGWTMDLLATERITGADGAREIDPTGLPREYRRRLLVLALVEQGEAELRGPTIDRLLDALERGNSSSLGQLQVSSANGIWHLSPAPPRRSH